MKWQSAVCTDVLLCECRVMKWHSAMCAGVLLYDSKFAVSIVPTNTVLYARPSWNNSGICHGVVSEVSCSCQTTLVSSCQLLLSAL